MYLKEIKIYGFKSFADKISMEFGSNLNGIVGPNGSGKSNVVDAVRWVLGEQSIKSLRADNATDVIFSGSASRKALNSASVTLVFDNEDHHLPIDFNEVSIKRVIYRNGDNEYYLNNSKCRLKDMLDVFVDSGTSRESFNIISQGKIDEILSTKPSDRRTIFEEAAGVLKYKKRKEEALRKLERTNDNLDRVNDLISELKLSLDPLEKQSNDARRYKVIKRELSDIEISLMVSDITKLNYEYKELKNDIESLEDTKLKITNNSTSYDIKLLENKNKLKTINDALEVKHKELITKSLEVEKIDSDIKLLDERKKHSNDININDNILSLNKNRLAIQDTINNLNNNIEVSKKSLEKLDVSINETNSRYKKYFDTKNEYENKLNSNNREISNLQYKINILEESINNSNSLPMAVKRILDNPKFKTHNVIGKLIDMNDEYIDAITTSLGGASSYLVVDTRNDAKEMVNYLSTNNYGRATFFPLDVIVPRYIDNDSLFKIRGNNSFVDIASNLVRYDIKYKDIILNQLGNVIVAKNINGANELSKLVGHKYKVITLDGQVVNIGGSITGGSKVRNNLIKEKYELEDYKKLINKLNDEVQELNSNITSLDSSLKLEENCMYELRISRNEAFDKLKNLERGLDSTKIEESKIDKELNDLSSIVSNNTVSEEEKLWNNYYQAKQMVDDINKNIELLTIDKKKIEDDITELDELSRKDNTNISKIEKDIHEKEVKLNRIEVKLDNLLVNLSNDYNITYENAKNNYILEIDSDIARDKVRNLKEQLSLIGEVNLGSIEEYERISERYNFLLKEHDELANAENTLLEIINDMDEVMKTKFTETFEQVRFEFKKVFRDLFRGGNAELVLTDPNDILNTGIEIKAEPSGKKLKNISLLSGGERTFTAISLLFAILNVRPVPFCLLDEVEAALDDANVESFCTYLNKYRHKTQFILITHKKKTMEYLDILYGITMQESGVSKLVSVKLEDIKKDLN